jgi:hypothetical protein
MSTPVRTYIHQNQENFRNVAFFCTAGGTKQFDDVFQEMKELSGKSPLSTLGIRAKEVKDGSYQPKLEKFLKEIQN